MDIEVDGPADSEGVTGLMELARHERPDLVNLQMVLVTSSMNHEYARKALEKTHSYDKKQDLLERMNQLKSLYFSARDKLALTHPERLESLENELRLQKQMVLSDQNLN